MPENRHPRREDELDTLSPSQFAGCLTPRAADSHKGSHGSLGLIGGAPGMLGALLLASRTALMAGAGRVFSHALDPHAGSVDPHTPEVMWRNAEDFWQAPLTALALGPGLGQDAQARRWLESCLADKRPLVLDADALNLLAAHPVLQHKLRQRSAPTFLTPHPAEAARLLGCSIEAIETDRVSACQQLHQISGAHVVLKGRHSLVTVGPLQAPLNLYQNPTGNPGLAAAGMGDVLTGLLGSLLAQGKPTDQALACAVYVHGLAGDECVAAGQGPIGLTASEVLLGIRQTLNRLVQATAR